MFGGCDSLAKILENLGRKEVSLPRTCFIASILMGFIFTISYSLLLWTAKISGKRLVDQACDCQGRCHSILHIYGRHRFYLTVVLICAIVASISLFDSLIPSR